MKQLAKMTERLFGQPMFKLLGIAQQMERHGQRILHFEKGDPNFDPPRVAVEAAIRALESGQNHYTNSMGLQELRLEITEYTQKDLGFLPDLKQVLVCPALEKMDRFHNRHF